MMSVCVGKGDNEGDGDHDNEDYNDGEVTIWWLHV